MESLSVVGTGNDCSVGGMLLAFFLKSPKGGTVNTMSHGQHQKGYDTVMLNGNIYYILQYDHRRGGAL